MSLLRITSIVLLFLYSILTQASVFFPKIKWNNLSEYQKIKIIQELQVSLDSFEASKSFDQVTLLQISIIKEAYAGNYNCFIAGWPSIKNKEGICVSPIKENSSYNNYLGCPDGELLCNPTIFGQQLCIKFNDDKSKNAAYSQCEEEFVKKGYQLTDVIDQIEPKDFDELWQAILEVCTTKENSKSIKAQCLSLKSRLSYLVDDDTPYYFKQAKESLAQGNIEAIDQDTKLLEKEMEQNNHIFEQDCAEKINESNTIYCRNLAMKVLNATELLSTLHHYLEINANPLDCANCSNEKSKETSTDNLSTMICTEQMRKEKSQECTKDFLCTVGSTLVGIPTFLYEKVKEKNNSCISSSNDCVTNLVASIIKSLVSTVTGLWDLLIIGKDWASEKMSQFWKWITTIEDKTSTTQQLICKLSDAELNEVKQSPLEWIKEKASIVWQGIKEWLKTDVYCQKWSGTPHYSTCLEPLVDLDCMSCRTQIIGTCSATGYVAGEILPAFLSGGAANLASKGAKGAKFVSEFIKASKAYSKIASGVEKLSEVKSIQLAIKTANNTRKGIQLTTRPTRAMIKLTSQIASKNLRAFKETAKYKGMLKFTQATAKYTGIKAFIDLNEAAYKAGFNLMEKVTTKSYLKSKDAIKLIAAQEISKEARLLELEQMVNKSEDLKNLTDQIKLSYKKSDELNKLRAQLKVRNKWISSKRNSKGKVSVLEKMEVLTNELKEINESFVKNMEIQFTKENIPYHKIYDDKNKYSVLKLDLSKSPKGKSAFEFYKRAKKYFNTENVTISLYENADVGSLGFFRSREARIEIGPNQALTLLENFVNSTGKHEVRHAMFFSKRLKGVKSTFHGKFIQASDDVLLNKFKYYDDYMSFEEIYNFSTDLQTFAQQLKNTARQSELLPMSYNKTVGLQKITQSSIDVSNDMIKSIDFYLTIDDIPKLSVEPTRLGFRDFRGRITALDLVSNEEKEMLANYLKIDSEYTKSVNSFVDNNLKGKVDNILELSTRYDIGAVTIEERKMINDLITSFNDSEAGVALLKYKKEESMKLLKYAKNRLEDLRKISQIQSKKALELELMLKKFKDGKIQPTGEEMNKIRSQMFNIASGVKENSKSFVLQKPQ